LTRARKDAKYFTDTNREILNVNYIQNVNYDNAHTEIFTCTFY
jgi:hypothetical protein